jgi:tight adherence protein C
MSATTLAVVWALVVVLGVLALPSSPRRSAAAGAGPVLSGAAGDAPVHHGAGRHHDGRVPGWRRLAIVLGVAATAGAARAVGRVRAPPADPAAVGAGLVLATAVMAVAPAAWPVALLSGALPPLLARARRRRAEAAAGRALLDELPEVVDLLALAVAAGLTAPLAVAAVGRRGEGALASGLRHATTVAARDGRRLPDVLDDVAGQLGAPGDAVRPLLAALSDAARHGTALGPGLERLAAEARVSRRHRAEERARRVPILLLFPLVTCTLPALGLLTIAPLAVGALRDLRA